LPLIKKYKTGIVALTMDDKEMPEDYEGRMRITRDLVKITQEEGISLNRVYFDHLVRPSSTTHSGLSWTQLPGSSAAIFFPPAKAIL